MKLIFCIEIHIKTSFIGDFQFLFILWDDHPKWWSSTGRGRKNLEVPRRGTQYMTSLWMYVCMYVCMYEGYWSSLSKRSKLTINVCHPDIASLWQMTVSLILDGYRLLLSNIIKAINASHHSIFMLILFYFTDTLILL
jgi:hypothetical protein